MLAARPCAPPLRSLPRRRRAMTPPAGAPARGGERAAPFAALARLFGAPGAREAPRGPEPPAAMSAGAGGSAGGAPRHLFFLVHGLAGQPEDLSCLREQLLARSGGAAAVHLARANVTRGGSTHDGIEAGGARVAAELRAVVAARPSLTHISLVGNSLGGLYCRYAAALEYDPAARTVAGLRPVTFLTTATPHLGVGAFGYLGLIPSWLQATGGRALGRTIAQLLLQDAPQPGGVPLLVQMATPAGAPPSGGAHLPFLPALSSFRRRIAYANAANDLLVAYETAAMLAGGTPAADVARAQARAALAAAAASAPPSPPNAPRVLYTRLREAAPADVAAADMAAPLRLALQARMAAGLGTLTWLETAVHFPGPLPNAHNKIVALRRDPLLTWLYSEGAAVVAHTAEALLADLARHGDDHAADVAGEGAAVERVAARGGGSSAGGYEPPRAAL